MNATSRRGRGNGPRRAAVSAVTLLAVAATVGVGAASRGYSSRPPFIAATTLSAAGPTDPIIETAGRTLLGGIGRPVGDAVDAAGDIFVVSGLFAPVQEIPKGGALATVPFNVGSPGGVAVDRAGDVFVTDGATNRVIERTTAGVQSVVALSGLNLPGAIAIDGAGDVFVVDAGNARVVELAKSGAQSVVGFSDVTKPTGIAVDAAGDLFVADDSTQGVYELTPAGAQTSLGFGALNAPQAVAVNSVGDVFVSDTSSGLQELLTDGTTKLIGFSSVTGIAVDGDDDIVVVSDGLGPTVVELNAAGAQIGIPLGVASWPSSVATDAAGDLFVADSGTERVLEVTKDGTQITRPVVGLGTNPFGGLPRSRVQRIAADTGGDVFLPDTWNDRVLELSAAGAQTVIPFTGISRPRAVAIDGTGDVFVDATVGGAGSVVELSDAGIQTTLPFTIVDSQEGLAVDPAGDVFIPDYDNGRVLEVPAGGSQVTVALSSPHPVALAIDATGDVFELRDGDQAMCGPLTMGVSELPHGGVERSLGCTELRSASGLAIAGNGDVLIADAGDNRVVAAPTTQARFTNPYNFQPDVDTTLSFAWSTVPAAQSYYLVVGTSFWGTDLVNSGPLPASQSSYAVPALPTGKQLFATLFTMTDGVWTSWEVINFMAQPGEASLVSPTPGQTGVDTNVPFSWSTIPAGQGYDLVVGTTPFGTDLVSSGILPEGRSSFPVPELPTGQILYATLLTKTDGAWTRFQAITFTAAPGQGILTSPRDHQAGVVASTPFAWTTVPAAQGYDLVVGTTRFGKDVASSGILAATQSSYSVPTLPKGRTLYATLLTKTNGAWTRYQAITFTTASFAAP